MLVEANVLLSLKEAAVLSRLPEDRVRREVERKVIAPNLVSAGSAHRLMFAEPEILFFAMLNSFSGTVELTPPARAKACRLLIDWEPFRLRERCKIIPANKRHFDMARLEAWTRVHRDPTFAASG